MTANACAHQQPLLSVIVPVYRPAPERLRACLDSLLGQGVDNVQILLVDDGSPEEVRAVLAEYAEKHPCMEVIHQENAGPGAARNAGLRQAKGSLLTFADADDTVLPGAWAQAIQAFDEPEVDCAVFGWQAGEGQHELCEKRTSLSAREAVRRIAGDDNDCGGGYVWNKMFRVRAPLPRFDEEVRFYEDKLWVLRMLLQSRRVALLPGVYYAYAPSPAGLTVGEAVARRLAHTCLAHDKMYALLQNSEPEAARAARSLQLRSCFSALLLAYPERKTRKNDYRACKKYLLATCQSISPRALCGVKDGIRWLIGQTYCRF